MFVSLVVVCTLVADVSMWYRIARAPASRLDVDHFMLHSAPFGSICRFQLLATLLVLVSQRTRDFIAVLMTLQPTHRPFAPPQ